MPETAELIKILVGIFSIAAIITSGAVYYMRRNVDRIDKTTSNDMKEMKEIKDVLNTNSAQTRKDYEHLVSHIDERIERIYTRLESNSSELKQYIAQEVSALKAKDYDQDIKIEHTREKVHGVNEELLKFKLEASEKYQKRHNDH